MPRGARPISPRIAVLLWAAACAAVGLGVAAVYLGLYPARGYRLPVGFDAPWYVWRASFVAGHGLGAIGTAARPGSEVVAALAGAVTGRSQVELAVLLPPVLAGAFGLALGALAVFGLGSWRWLTAATTGGILLGATRLVDENVATLLFLVVALAALVPLVSLSASGGQGPGLRGDALAWGSALLLVAAGLAHWLFLAVLLVILAIAAALLWPASRRQRAAGLPLLRTATGVLAGAGAVAAGAMAVMIGAVLRAPVDTIEVREDPARFLPKLGTDARRLALPVLAPVAVVGATLLGHDVRSIPRRALDANRSLPRELVLGWLLGAWAAVSIVGLAYGAMTKKLPPHRFLELLVVVPGVLAMAHLAGAISEWVRGRHGRVAAAAIGLVAALALAVPGVVAWYGSGASKPWIDGAAFQQAEVVSAWSRTLPAGQPFVVLVSPTGTAGTLSAALKERTIRAALPANRQEAFHLFAGTAGELAARRQPTTPNPAMNAAILPYWLDVRPVLASDPPVVVLQRFDPSDYASPQADGRSLGPGVLLLGGATGSSGPFLPPPSAEAFPGALAAGVWTAALLGLLAAAGLGWAIAIHGWGAPPAVLFGSAPAVGTGALVLAGTVVSRLGVGLGGWAGVATALAVATGGAAAAVLRRRAR